MSEVQGFRVDVEPLSNLRASCQGAFQPVFGSRMASLWRTAWQVTLGLRC